MGIREKKRDLNPNMTFEEFEALANRQPNLKGNWIYRVTQTMFDNSLKHPYPKFELDYSRKCYFKTFPSAEKFVKKHTKDVTVVGSCRFDVAHRSNMADMGRNGFMIKTANCLTTPFFRQG